MSERGLNEAIKAAGILKTSGYTFDLCLTSCLERAKHTAQIINDELPTPVDNIQQDWRLNERHYGALQGEPRSEMTQKYGRSDVMSWRYNYHAQPPELSEDDPRWQEQLGRLPQIPLAQHPRSESMYQAVKRTMPVWEDMITPALRAEKNVLVIAHTNPIRCIVSEIEGYNEKQSAAFRISTATPRHYQFDDDLSLLGVSDLTNDPKAKFRQWATRRLMNVTGKF